jgi:hypothetical protein
MLYQNKFFKSFSKIFEIHQIFLKFQNFLTYFILLNTTGKERSPSSCKELELYVYIQCHYCQSKLYNLQKKLNVQQYLITYQLCAQVTGPFLTLQKFTFLK